VGHALEEVALVLAAIGKRQHPIAFTLHDFYIRISQMKEIIYSSLLSANAIIDNDTILQIIYYCC
jgi:hypothetical protein